MFLLKKIISAVLLPPVSPLLLSVFGIWLARRRPRLGHGLIAAGIASLWLLSTPWVAHRLMDSLQYAAPITPEELGRAEAIVILGAGNYHMAPEYGGDTVSRLALERLRHGARLARASGLPVAVAGGSPDGGRAEAETMRESLWTDFGVRPRWMESSSRDTAENVAYLVPMLKQDNVRHIALVTHAWHLPRAREQFERHGIDVLPAPTGYSTDDPDPVRRCLPGTSALEKSRLALHEYLGRLAIRLSAAPP